MAKARQTQAPADLSPDQKRDLWRWAQEKYPWMTKQQVRAAVDDCLEWFAAKGTRWADWKLVCMRWIRENVASGKIREQTPLDSRAKEREREQLAERRRRMREAQQELERIGPLGVEEIIAWSRETRGF